MTDPRDAIYGRYDTEKPVVVFGTQGLSQLTAYVLTHDSPFDVLGYVVDQAYLATSPSPDDLPVFAFESLPDQWGPDECQLIIPLGYTQINGLRRDRYEAAQAMGYSLVSYVSSKACVWPNLQIGHNSLIFEHTVIQPYARLGHNCVIRSSVHLSHHALVHDHCFVAAGVVTGGGVSLGEQSFVGLGAIVRDGVALAQKTFVGAGAVVLADTEANGLYVGSPAKRQSKAADTI